VGVQGAASLASGPGSAGGYFESYAENGVGAWGQAHADTGATVGLRGTSSGTGDAAGVLGEGYDSAAGGRFESATGVAVRARSDSGNIIEGYNGTQLAFKVDNAGNVYADGTFQSPAADFAELLPGTAGLEPGDVLAVGPDGLVTLASADIATAVIGVYSTQPAFLGGVSATRRQQQGSVPVAIMGVVPVKVTAENGPIRPNDVLAVSRTRTGHATRAVPLFVVAGGESVFAGGTLVGRALEGLSSGDGVIRALIQLR
jgi:hypothetical protein